MPIPTPMEGFHVEALDGEVVLLNPERNLVIHGNQTGALVWQLCDGKRSVEEIVEILGAAYPEAREEIQADIPEMIRMLAAQGILRTE